MGAFLESRTLRVGSGRVSNENTHAKRIGRFQLKREVARGGMGIVFEAYDSDLEQAVALKVLHPWSAPEDEARFRHEARVIARLRHPNVVRVYALGRDAGRWYLVLDYVDGESLRERLERDGPLEGPDAAAILEPIARAVHYAHCRGVVHRDLKPANVLLPRLGGPMLVDFGLAKELAATSSQPITQHGAVLGTPPYMAPEQVLGGRELDSRTDVYGLGATLYRMLSGRHPFDGTMLEVLDAVINQEPTPLSSLVEVDPRLEAICQRCMAKDPGERYRTAEEVAHALASYAAAPLPQVSWVSSTFAWPTRATFFYGRGPQVVPRGVRFVRRNALLPAAAALVAACAVLPLGAMLASRPGDERALGGGAQSARVDDLGRRVLPGRARIERSATQAAEREPAPSDAPEDGDADLAGRRLRQTGERQEVAPPEPPASDEAEASGEPDAVLDGDREARRALALLELEPRVALAAGRGGAAGVLVSLVRDPSASSVAPEISARVLHDEDPSTREAQTLGPPAGEVPLDTLDVPPDAASAYADPQAQPDVVARALESFAQAPLPAPAVRPFDELLTLDGRGPAYRAVHLQQSLGSASSAQLVPFGGVVFSARGREIDWLLADEVRSEAALPYDVASVAVVGPSAFVGTAGPAGSEGGNVYRRTLDGRWVLSFDGAGDHVLVASLGTELYALSWTAGSGAEVYRLAVSALVDPAASWSKVATLGAERPSHAVVYGGALWVVCSPELPDAELTLYTGRGSAWGQVEADELGKPKKETVARATKLVLAGGNLFLTVAYLDAETGVPDGGELLACDLGESKLEFERLGKRLKDGDVPLSLAVHESTVYVGTLSGRLLYLVPDPKQKKPDDFKPTFEEELVPSSLGIHSLLPRNNGALMLGQFGPAATDVVLRVREP